MQPVMSIDVEDWFQVENLRGQIDRDQWETLPRRVEANTDRILQIFAETNTRATFFCLGWIAERHRALIKRIVTAGHEVASHGYAHRLIYEQSEEDFRTDIITAKAILEEITGEPVRGYRAPSFSITPAALRILQETGHQYDSSWFPVTGHDRYGRVDMHTLAREGTATGSTTLAAPAVIPLQSGLQELCITTATVGKRPVPWGGGGYFRLYPAALFRAGFGRAVTRAGGGCFYLHPWEVDPEQPRVSGLPWSYAFRHYVNLQHTAVRLRKLCQTISFTRGDHALGLTAPPRHT